MFLALLMFGVSWTAPRWSRFLTASGPAASVDDLREAASLEAPAAPVESRILVQLFFQSPDRDGLVAEPRFVRFNAELHEQIERVVEELIRGSEHGLLPTLPVGTRIDAIHVLDDGVAVLALKPGAVTRAAVADPAAAEAAEGASEALEDPTPAGALALGGSREELLTVYSLVNSVVVNFPAVRRVRLLMDVPGRWDLAGHVDLRRALAADMTLVVPPEEWRYAPPVAGVTEPQAAPHPPEPMSEEPS